MKINRSVETDQGTVVFQGVLEGKELDLVLEVGLNTLLEEGALPFLSAISINRSSLMAEPEQEQ